MKSEFIESKQHGKLTMMVDRLGVTNVLMNPRKDRIISEQVTRKEGLECRLAISLGDKGSAVQLIGGHRDY